MSLAVLSAEDRPVRRIRPLGTKSSATIADFRAHPDKLFSPEDIAASGLCGSRPAQHRAIKAGRLPKPLRTLAGLPRWTGKMLADAADAAASAIAAEVSP